MTYQKPLRSSVEAFLLKPEKPMGYKETQANEVKPTMKKLKKKSVKQGIIVVPETSEEENEALV